MALPRSYLPRALLEKLRGNEEEDVTERNNEDDDDEWKEEWKEAVPPPMLGRKEGEADDDDDARKQAPPPPLVEGVSESTFHQGKLGWRHGAGAAADVKLCMEPPSACATAQRNERTRACNARRSHSGMQ